MTVNAEVVSERKKKLKALPRELEEQNKSDLKTTKQNMDISQITAELKETEIQTQIEITSA